MKEPIEKYQFKDGLNHEFEIVDIEKVFNIKKDMMIVPHRAQFYHVLWIEKGDANHFIDFNPIKIEDNIIIFMPQNCVNMFDRDGSYKGKAIIFTDSFFCKNNHDTQFLRSSMLLSGSMALYSDVFPRMG